MNVSGKTVVVTGGTGGIGKWTAQGITQTGASVIIVGRNVERGNALVDALKDETGNPNIKFIAADLSSQAEVRRVAAEVEKTFPRLDVLINNVGGLYRERWETVDGIEATFAMNVVNPVLLTQLLLPLLMKSRAARVLNLTSSVHRLAQVDFDNLQAEKSFRGMDTYAHSKLLGLLAMFKLANMLQYSSVTVNAVDPGSATTDMTQAITPDMLPWYMRVVLPVFSKLQPASTAIRAANSSIFAATSPELEGVTGAYISPGSKIGKASKHAYDEDAAERLWEIVSDLIEQKSSETQTR